MSKKFLLPTVVTLVVLIAVLIYDKPVFEYKKINGRIQGTTYNITYEYLKGKDLQPEIEKELHEFDLSLSTYEPQSVISRINRNEQGVEADVYLIEVFREAKRISLLTNGAFDITVGPLVNAFGFGPSNAINIDTAVIDTLLRYVGMDKVDLQGTRIIKKYPDIQLDVNAIAQGYSVDIICAFLDKKKIKNYLVEIGGELRCKGLNPKAGQWRVGVDKPIEGNNIPGENMQAVVAVSNKSLATSGNYRKFYEKDGIKYVHSLDPRTGYPVLSKLLSTTVIADQCMEADAFATAFMVMGLEKSIEFLQNYDKIDAYLVYSGDSGKLLTYSTEGMKKLILDEEK